MTDTVSSPADEAFAPGSRVQSLTFLATDEELLLLLQGQRGALMKLYPEGEEELSRGVEQAVKRSLIARRAVAFDDDTGKLELLQPWAGLVETLSTGDRFLRITADGDDRSARLVLVGEDALFTVDRDPAGVHTVTISIPEYAAQIATELLIGDEIRDADGDGALDSSEPARISEDALAKGRQALDDGNDALGQDLLGPSTEFFRAAIRTFRVESMEMTGGIVHGSEFDVLDAGALGWAHVVYADDNAQDVIVTPLTDDALAALMAEALAS